MREWCLARLARLELKKVRLLPIINQAVATAITSVEHKEALAQVTRRDHALLLEFFRCRDEAGAEHAMAIYMRHAMDEMGLEER